MQEGFEATEQQLRQWSDACLIAKMILIDPVGLGGVWVKSSAHPVRDIWLKGVQKLVDQQVPFMKIPSNTDEDALLGAIDLFQTLEKQQKVYSRGLIDQVDGGLFLLTMGERLRSHTAALLTQAFDNKQHFGMIAFDESLPEEDQQLLPRLQERLGFQIRLDNLTHRHCEFDEEPIDILELRNQLASITIPTEALEAIITAANALGIDSVRVEMYVVRASKVIAVLRGDTELIQADIATATRLIFAHRITTLPSAEQSPPEQELENQENQDQETAEPPPPPESPQNQSDHPDESPPEETQPDEPTPSMSREQLEDMIIEASKAQLPQSILDSFAQEKKLIKSTENMQGKAGQIKKGMTSGRALASRKGLPQSGKKIDILKTIQSASPWQKIRRLESSRQGISDQKILIKADDIYLKNYVQRSTTVTLFVVDASGSSAMERLAEAKGAVELLLAQCYIRRDQVALMTFRGKTVDLILPPTRSLVRAKRLLTSMPGGGGTPLANAIDASHQFAAQLKSKGQTPLIIIMTDGRANVTAKGIGGREQAYADALQAAMRARHHELLSLFVDTSFVPQDATKELAQQLGAKYFPLPQGKSSGVVQAAQILLS